MNELLEKQLDELEEDAGDIGHHTIYNGVIRREIVNKFITDLRKQDEQELIKMVKTMDKGNSIHCPGFKTVIAVDRDDVAKIIKEYYEK